LTAAAPGVILGGMLESARSKSLRRGARGLSTALGAAAILLAGCGDEQLSPVVVPAFSLPAQFDQSPCTPGSLAGLDPAGIWHQDNTTTTQAQFPSAMRFDETPEGLTAHINGVAASTVQQTSDHLLVRMEYQTSQGVPRIRAYYACGMAPDGSLLGSFARCDGGECYNGTFRSVRIQRIAGESESQGIEKLAEFSGDASWVPPSESGLSVNVRVQDGVAYLARYKDGLRVIDVSNPSAPKELGASPTTRTDELYNDVKIADGPGGRRYVLMASNRRGVVVIDVTAPASPVEVTTFPPIPEGDPYINVHTLFLETIAGKTLAYVADINTQGLDVYDVTEPAAPSPIVEYTHPLVAHDRSAHLHDLYVENGRAYLSYWSAGLTVVDVAADPPAATLVGRYDSYERRTNHSNWATTVGGRKIAVSGDEDFGAHVHIVDADDASPTFMTRIGEFQLRPEVSVHNIMAFGDKAYIAYYQDGLRILDLADPTNPKLTSYFNTWDGRNGASFYEGATGIDVDLAAGLIYIADTERGLLIFREVN
jgi:hypothetical protein